MFWVTVNVLYLIPRDPIKSALCGNVKDKAHIFSANSGIMPLGV